MARKRRKHSKIDKLSPELKATVEDMMKADFTYAEIADYIKEQTEGVNGYADDRRKSAADREGR